MSEIQHLYGPNVHIINNVYLSGLLAKLCSSTTLQPEINLLVEILYQNILIEVMNKEFPKEISEVETRMIPYHPEAVLKYDRIKTDQKVISVNLARAGTYPSHVVFNSLHYSISPLRLRQDHIFAARSTNDSQQVIGTDLGACKIGGDKDQSIVLIPDPMGATGSTLVSAVNHYKAHVPGKAHKIIALHLIITPEYLRHMTKAHPDVLIYSLRLDRGLSDKAILNTIPGTKWDLEKGLNEKGYIVPGGGGFGEIMNNSFV